MSDGNQLYGSGEMKRTSIRAHEGLLDAFDEFVAESSHDSRTDALRSMMRQAVDSEPESQTPLDPPEDDRLALGYQKLCRCASENGMVRPKSAESLLASALNVSKSEVKPTVLRPLANRGYLICHSNLYGHVAWEIVGWNDE